MDLVDRGIKTGNYLPQLDVTTAEFVLVMLLLFNVILFVFRI